MKHLTDPFRRLLSSASSVPRCPHAIGVPNKSRSMATAPNRLPLGQWARSTHTSLQPRPFVLNQLLAEVMPKITDVRDSEPKGTRTEHWVVFLTSRTMFNT